MGLPSVSFDHFGIFVTDLDKMSRFYERVLGFVTTDSGTGSTGLKFRFLTRDANCHHQLVLAESRPPDMPFNNVNQISMLVQTLDDLRKLNTILEADPEVSGITYMDHGISWSVYFDDPEGNWVELCVNSPFYSPQPFRQELNLSMKDDEILALTEQRCREKPGFCSREAWQARVQKQIDATQS